MPHHWHVRMEMFEIPMERQQEKETDNDDGRTCILK
jgi:hypothetical protein